MCNLLLNQYNSVFSTPCREKDITNPEEFFNVEDFNDNDILSDITINQSVICDAINEMFSSSASGPDGLLAIYLKSVVMNFLSLCKSYLQYNFLRTI